MDSTRLSIILWRDMQNKFSRMSNKDAQHAWSSTKDAQMSPLDFRTPVSVLCFFLGQASDNQTRTTSILIFKNIPTILKISYIKLCISKWESPNRHWDNVIFLVPIATTHESYQHVSFSQSEFNKKQLKQTSNSNFSADHYT
jgi:hypothetical protein